MRENRFRVWDKIAKQMYYPEEAKYCLNMVGTVCHDLDVEGERLMNVNYRTKAMLSTGQKDKQGKEIYEGDVVEFSNYSDMSEKDLKECEVESFTSSIGKIVWEEDGFEVDKIKLGKVIYKSTKWGRNKFTEDFYGYEGREFIWKDLIVIGNLYENPGLLKEKL